MKLFLFLIIFYCLFTGNLSAQIIWTGPKIFFEKKNHADYNLPENQDRLTDSVWITRQFSQGIYNAARENAYLSPVSPAGTEWAFGSTANLPSLVFDSWENTINSQPPQMIDKEMVLHLIFEDIYIDIKFLSWQRSNSGGGFSYERSGNQFTGINELTTIEFVKLFPNPVNHFLYLEIDPEQIGSDRVEIRIYNAHGSLTTHHLLFCDGGNQILEMDISHLTPGVHYIQLTDQVQMVRQKLIIN